MSLVELVTHLWWEKLPSFDMFSPEDNMGLEDVLHVHPRSTNEI